MYMYVCPYEFMCTTYSHVGANNETQVLWKNNKCSSPPSYQPLQLLFLPSSFPIPSLSLSLIIFLIIKSISSQ